MQGRSKHYAKGYKEGLNSTREWSHTDITLVSSELTKRGMNALDAADYIEGLCDGINERNDTDIGEPGGDNSESWYTYKNAQEADRKRKNRTR